MNFASTLLVQLKDKLDKITDQSVRNDIETEIRKADLDLLDKINQIAQQVSSSASPTKEVIYTPTFHRLRARAPTVNFTWTRVGNRIKVMGVFTPGTSTAVPLQKISLTEALWWS